MRRRRSRSRTASTAETAARTEAGPRLGGLPYAHISYGRASDAPDSRVAQAFAPACPRGSGGRPREGGDPSLTSDAAAAGGELVGLPRQPREPRLGPGSEAGATPAFARAGGWGNAMPRHRAQMCESGRLGGRGDDFGLGSKYDPIRTDYAPGGSEPGVGDLERPNVRTPAQASRLPAAEKFFDRYCPTPLNLEGSRRVRLWIGCAGFFSGAGPGARRIP